MPFSIQNNTEIKLVNIINHVNDAYISHVNTQCKTKIHPYAKLFDIRTYLVLTKEIASQRFNWIT